MTHDRRTFMAASASAVAAASVGKAAATEKSDFLDIIDCHTHFYDPTRAAGVPWPGKNSPLYRPVYPKHLRELKVFRPVTGTVVVEASKWVEDNDWILDLAKDDPWIVGLVGNVLPGSDDYTRHVRRLAKNPLFRGIRVRTTQLAELEASKKLDDLKLLADLDLQLDVLGDATTPITVARAAAALPELRMVINHVGNVKIDENAPPKDWVDGMRAAADQENAFCKISALVEGAARDGRKAPGDLEFYRPYIDVVWNAFGDDRVIYGSNWPVSDRGADYETLQRIVLEYAFEKGDQATRKFCSLNAKRVYKWVERAGRLG